MSLKGERMNICFVGKMNVGKSTLINKIVSQDVSIVSEVAGTTTDPVSKRYELIPIGAVSFFDTAGYDDTTALGEKRLSATIRVLYKSDLAVVVLDEQGMKAQDFDIISRLEDFKIPYIVVFNKVDIKEANKDDIAYFKQKEIEVVSFSSISSSPEIIKTAIIKAVERIKKKELLVLSGLIKKGDTVVLVMVTDSSAPKGRIILPQMQVLREILDAGATAICCGEEELSDTIDNLSTKPNLVITDSQVIDRVSRAVPKGIVLTTFSVLYARYKGDLKYLIQGIEALDSVGKDDKILIAEGCSHHTTCDDIGSVKIPKWLDEYLDCTPTKEVTTGSHFPNDLDKYKLVIHCGGCMLTRTEMLNRMKAGKDQNVPITNYGMFISKVNGVLDRVTKDLKEESD